MDTQKIPHVPYLFCFGDNAGLIKRHISQHIYGKAQMIPPITAMFKADVKVPFTVVTCRSIFTEGIQSVLPKCSQLPNLHKAL